VLFKLDENLGDRGQKRLQEAGHDVMTVREQHLCGRPDSQVIDVCVLEKRCLITLDTDFADTLTYPPEKYAGIILLRLPRKPVLSDIDTAIETVIEALNRGADITGKLWVVRRGTIRQFMPLSNPY
jgi:predicted nuclease of predicted toxin-antitoxin system